ncbi:MAG TPA: MFS transporter [Solirubrobacteraceae bacterium]|jgi:MFS family permease
MRALKVIEGPFRLLFAARAASALGDQLVPVALSFAVLDLTGSVGDLGLVLGARTAALIVFVLIGGVWADRLSRKHVMLSADAVRMLAQGASAALLLGGAARVWELVALQAAYGAAEGFFGPASIAIVPDTVPAAKLQEANALLGLTENAAAVLGPALAGVIVAVAGAGWGLAADGATFAVGIALLLPMRTGEAAAGGAARARAGMLTELRAGWHAFRARSWLWITVLFFTLYMGLVYAPYQVLGPQIARTSLGGAGAWAAISAALGVGAVGGGLIGLRWKPVHPLRATFLVFAVSGPALLLGLAVHAPLPALLAVAFLDGAASSVFNALWFTAQHAEIPPGELSRVSSWDYLGTLVLSPAGLAVTGPIALAIGFSATLYGAGALSFALTVAVLLVPAVRNFAPRARAGAAGQ